MLQMVGFPSLLRLNYIAFYVDSTSSVSTHKLMDI